MNKLKFATVAITLFIAGILFFSEEEIPKSECEICFSNKVKVTDPPCLQMYFSIEKFAEKYNIPKRFAYGIAFAETRYGGPFDWNYKHTQTSYAGAIGPMQIMPSTADMMWPGKKISNKKLMTDIQFNVETSMKLLRRLYDRYGNWKTVFGAYNTGTPCVNGYAERVYAHKINW
jgi:soluble lytic murein transglycosylase-like protein